MKGCGISVRYMAYALRGFPPDDVFAQAMFAFELAASDPRITGVNLVMPEDWFVPMRDYDLHMRMYAFLRRQYPGVNVALHAGELALGLVPPEKLGLHVRQAVSIAAAQRIGHATDIMYDTEPAALLRVMAKRRIPVEVSLSSSDIILGVRGSRHPLRQFLRAGVPVVIATDDEGVARSDLTNEYQRAVEEHGIGYSDIKRISLNSIEYSFLPTEEKARLMTRLIAALTVFEAATLKSLSRETKLGS
jgi:adenosine deaminase